jgi:hypothetical protein
MDQANHNKTYNSQIAKSLFLRLDEQSYVTNCPMLKKFYKKNEHKVGMQTFPNKSASISQKLGFDWHYTSHSNDRLRAHLKKALFKFPSSALSFSVTENRALEERLRNQTLTARERKEDRLRMKT